MAKLIDSETIKIQKINMIKETDRYILIFELIILNKIYILRIILYYRN